MVFMKCEDDHHSQQLVPFSWENKLPPPPCPSDKLTKFMLYQGEPLNIPLPPGAFDQRPLRRRKRMFKLEDDPFLVAYKECTKSSPSQMKSSLSKSYSLVKTLSGYFSCKASSHNVRDSIAVRIRQPEPQPSDDEDLRLSDPIPKP